MNNTHHFSRFSILKSPIIDLRLFFPYTDSRKTEDGPMAHGRHGTDPPRDQTAAMDAAGTTAGYGSDAENATGALSYAETPNNTLVGFADAGYLSDPHKGRSQTGYMFTIGNMTISWRSTKQTLVATSSNHAEIIALHEAVRECVWLRTIIKHIRETMD